MMDIVQRLGAIARRYSTEESAASDALAEIQKLRDKNESLQRRVADLALAAMEVETKAGLKPDHGMRRFTAYRPNVPDTHTEDQRNAPDEVQYEGVIFTDGTCVLRWRTAVNSCSVWDSFNAAMRIHGHPEYGTRIVFHDSPRPTIGGPGCDIDLTQWDTSKGLDWGKVFGSQRTIG